MGKSTNLFRNTFSLALATLGLGGCGASAQVNRAVADYEIPEGMETAVLGAGCFWCVEAFYERLVGVDEAISGYAGGEEPDPSYKEVARGATSHAEVVKVIYDPESISYRELIDFFWTTHDATRGDGVWPDFGPQYRSILLYADEAEKTVIDASRKAYEAEANVKVATDIKPLETFYPAETYHQDFAAKNPRNSYVQRVLIPKLKKLGFEP